MYHRSEQEIWGLRRQTTPELIRLLEENRGATKEFEVAFNEALGREIARRAKIMHDGLVEIQECGRKEAGYGYTCSEMAASTLVESGENK